jgi:hypothetical protein
MKTRQMIIAAASALALLAGSAIAQDGKTPPPVKVGGPAGATGAAPTANPTGPAVQPPAPTPPAAPTPKVMRWTSPELEKIGTMLAGSWKTTTAVAQAGDAASKAEVVISFAPVLLEGVTDAMYVETARSDSMHAPYRQAIFQLYKFKDGVRLRTFEFHKKASPDALAGFWLAPEFFPDFTRDNLIATLDVELKPQGAGYAGKTPYPYPTGVGGAVEMTSELTITPDQIVSIDRGIGADGKVVWGSAENEKYTFAKFKPDVAAKRLEGGLVVVEYNKPTEGKEVAAGDRVTAHYSGFLANGTRFDSSRDRGNPFTFTQGQLIPGWNVGLLGLRKGSIARVIIPPALGYGDRPQRVIPANSTLYFEVEIMGVEVAPPPPEVKPGEPVLPTTLPPGGSLPKKLDIKPVEQPKQTPEQPK